MFNTKTNRLPKKRTINKYRCCNVVFKVKSDIIYFKKSVYLISVF